jgi:hypothetical protein
MKQLVIGVRFFGKKDSNDSQLHLQVCPGTPVIFSNENRLAKYFVFEEHQGHGSIFSTLSRSSVLSPEKGLYL